MSDVKSESKNQQPQNRTALCGTLICRGGTWYWSDGEIAVGISDLTADAHYNFRLRHNGTGAGSLVEVPVRAMYEDFDLEWVREACDEGEYQRVVSGDYHHHVLHLDGEQARKTSRGPYVALVPEADWALHWYEAGPIGVQWDQVNENAILSRAKSLGANWEGAE